MRFAFLVGVDAHAAVFRTVRPWTAVLIVAWLGCATFPDTPRTSTSTVSYRAVGVQGDVTAAVLRCVGSDKELRTHRLSEAQVDSLRACVSSFSAAPRTPIVTPRGVDLVALYVDHEGGRTRMEVSPTQVDVREALAVQSPCLYELLLPIVSDLCWDGQTTRPSERGVGSPAP